MRILCGSCLPHENQSFAAIERGSSFVRYFKDTDLPVSALLICANGFFLTFSRGGIAPNVFAILSIASFSSISPTIDISM